MPVHLSAPPNWSFTDPNPFTPDGAYGHAWSAFCLLDKDHDQLYTGQSGRGPFAARFGCRVAQLPHRLADFLRYEHAHGRTVILSFPPEIDLDAFIARAMAETPGPNVVRPYDPPFVVHATTLPAWQAIQADGELKAASLLAPRPTFPGGSGASSPIEQYLSNEPPEYRDYIMFGEMESTGPEIVMASVQAGQFIMDENAFFQPGVRLYFDHHRIIRDGLAIRDGLHLLKVHHRLPLHPYLLAAITASDLASHATIPFWTLRSFVDHANLAFWEKTNLAAGQQPGS